MKNQSLIPGSLFRHSRSGKLYKIIGIAKHSETLEDLVVYEPQYDNELSKLWVRPVSIFLESVAVDGQSVPRFVIQPNVSS